MRHPDWPARFESFLRERRAAKFGYGTHDCCLFVADAVLAMTGQDIAQEYRSKYRSRKEALELAYALTCKRSIQALVEQGLSGFRAISVMAAQRGDIILVDRGRDCSLGLLALNGKEILAAAEGGYLRLPLMLGRRAWRI